MKKTVVYAASALVAFAILAETSFAQENVRPRRPNFFERLFGVEPVRRPRAERNRAWWEDDESGVRVIRGDEEGRKKKVAVRAVDKPSAKPKRGALAASVTLDPGSDPGLGFGNKDYIPVKLMPVIEPTVAKTPALETGAAAIQLVLADRTSNIRATADVRAAVLSLYKSNSFKPLWTENGNVTVRGIAVLDLLGNAAQEGLEPLRYKPAVLQQFDGAVAALDGDGLGLAQLDVGLSVAAVTYAQHISGGAFEPERLSAYHDLVSQRVTADAALRVLAYSPFPADYLKSLAPKHPAYTALKSELAKLRIQKPAQSTSFAEGKRVRIGQKDPRVAVLRKRLFDDGFATADDLAAQDDKEVLLDKDLAKALKKFQEAKGLAQTSNLDEATVKALNGPDVVELEDKLVASLERVRWLPKDLGARHVFVNQASYRVNVMNEGKVVWASDVIVGKPTTQTNVFSDTFETVVFNPTWGMPQSILRNEYLPKLRSDPGYLDKKGFTTIAASGKVVSSRSVNWNSADALAGIGVVQPAGETNALGKIKFMFPNKHSIYMHDTPGQDLFAKQFRNFSYGCVRVKNPREFAEVLLGMSAQDVNDAIDTGETKNVKVTRKTQVHLAYFTAWPDEQGIVRYHSDAYARDATLKKARATMFKLAGGGTGDKMVQNVKALPVD